MSKTKPVTDGLMTQLKVLRMRPDAILPTYAHGPAEDAGMDLYAVDAVELRAGERAFVNTGLQVEIPAGFELQVRSRSSLALKGVTVANQPGTIDPGYRGELRVLLANNTLAGFQIEPGMRIAQAILARYEMADVTEVQELATSARGAGGFGSTGE